MRYWPTDYIVYRGVRGYNRQSQRGEVRTVGGWYFVAVVMCLFFLPLAYWFWNVWFLEIFPATVLGVTAVFVILGVVESLLVKRRR